MAPKFQIGYQLKNSSDELCRHLAMTEVTFVDELREVQGQRALKLLRDRKSDSGPDVPVTVNPDLFRMHLKPGGIPDIETMKQIFPYRGP